MYNIYNIYIYVLYIIYIYICIYIYIYMYLKKEPQCGKNNNKKYTHI